MAECPRIRRSPDGELKIWYCHDYRNCPNCRHLAAEALASQLARAELVFVMSMTTKESVKIIRKLSKACYKKIPQANDMVVLFHNRVDKTGHRWIGDVSDLELMISLIPAGKRVSGHLGGRAEVVSHPYTSLDLKVRGSERNNRNQRRKRIKKELCRRRRADWKIVRDRQMLAIIDRDGYVCQECGEMTGLEVDHIVPLSKGGSDDLENLQLLCFRCNRSKAAKGYRLRKYPIT